jgi:hypothetical protein
MESDNLRIKIKELYTFSINKDAFKSELYSKHIDVLDTLLQNLDNYSDTRIYLTASDYLRFKYLKDINVII